VANMSDKCLPALHPYRNEFQESSWSKGRLVPKTDNLILIYELTVYKMWDPQRLTTLWVSTAWYLSRIAGKILVLNILLSRFLERRQKDK
jgi:hypothetical protein